MPDIPPDHPEKLLGAELRNVVKDVSDGGTLPTRHAKAMRAQTMTPQLAREQRVSALLMKWADGGRLTPEELAEIQTVDPGFVAAGTAVRATSSAATPGDAISSEPKAKLNKEQIARYEKLYKKNWRSLYRWVEKGEKAGDPCPLDDPRAMLNWWPKHNTWRVPPEIEEAAVAAAIASKDDERSTTPAPAPDPASPDLSHSSHQSHSSHAPPPPPPATKGIRLEDFDPEEGDRLHELKQLQSAKFDQLKDAFNNVLPTNALESSYVKLCETIDKIETRVIERMKKRGLYVLRDEVERDLAKNADLLRQTRESMERRVLENCPSLNTDQRTEVSAAIYKARQKEDSIFARLDCLKPDELFRELSAA